MESTKLHAAIPCSPNMGHLVSVLEPGKCLAIHHSLEVTILVNPNYSIPQLPLNTSASANSLQSTSPA
ncbi:hypothetical protein ACSBR2_010052 [Camellia fascicularis]